MELKTYQGKSMAEALEKVKLDLGRGAVILHTRTVRRGGVMGVGARSVVEITASRDPGLQPKADRPVYTARRESVAPIAPIASATATRNRRAVEAAVPDAAGPVSAGRSMSGGPDALAQISCSTSALRSEMEELRTMVRQLLDREKLPESVNAFAEPAPVAAPPPVPDELRDYYAKLIQNAVADELAREVVGRAKERLNDWRARLQTVGPAAAEPLDFQQLIPNALLEVIERMLPAADPVQIVPGHGTKFVALVGPTGVGKTTTIAKLAAQFKLRDRKRVGLITTDTYRIAAVAQLKAYADILSVPLEVVYTPDELSDTMRRMQGFDVVLIDTSGRSQNDSEHLDDLQAFLAKAREAARLAAQTGRAPGDAAAADTQDAAEEAAPCGSGNGSAYRPLETHLVMSCTAHANQLRQVLDRFASVGIDRVVFTKLDEAVGVGVILNIAHRLDVQLSYLTTGQDVPDDIEVGSRRRIAEMVLSFKQPPTGGGCAEPPKGSAAPAVNQLA